MATTEKDDSRSPSPRGDEDGSTLPYIVHSTPLKQTPAWLDHFNARDIKTLVKCTLAVWIMTLFIFIDKTLSVIGQATFFGCIVLIILPPSGIVFLHLMGMFTILVGMGLAWGWGVITMKAALATRPQAQLQARYGELQRSMPQNTTNSGQASGQATYTQIAIYEGFMLDTRITITYFCMIGLFVYLMARLRVVAPKLTLMSIFGIIVIDIFLTIGPLLPTFLGTIPKMLVLPAAIGVGVGTACNILIFPQSGVSIIVDGMRGLLAPLPGFLAALQWHFGHPDSQFDAAQVQKLRLGLAAKFQALGPVAQFLPMDLAYGRWGPSDVKGLQKPLREVVIAFEGLVQVSSIRGRSKAKEDALQEAAEAFSQEMGDGSNNNNNNNSAPPVAYHQIARAINLRASLRHPATADLTVKTMAALDTCARPLLQSATQALAAIDEALARKRGSRTSLQAALARHQQAAEALEQARSVFAQTASHHLIEPHAHLFDADGHIIRPPPETSGGMPLVPLLLGLLFQERLQNAAAAVSRLLAACVAVEQQRQRARLWLPQALSHLLLWTVSTDEDAPVTSQLYPVRRTTTTASTARAKRRTKPKKASPVVDAALDDDSAAARLQEMRNPHRRPRTRASQALLAVIDWLTGDAGILGLRMLAVTVALAVPAALPATAGFYYREKGLWALIMAQTSLVPFASEFVSGLLIRTAATVAGGVVGLVCWYIGAGSGSGNAYGLAAVMAVMLVPLMWARLLLPPTQMMSVVMCGATVYLVVAYSWVDTHIPSYGNPGVGYDVFWRRVLLVLIGFAAATIVTFLPRPASGGRHGRQLLAEQLTAVQEHYALFVSTWRDPPADLTDVIEQESLASSDLLLSLLPALRLTRFEFSTSTLNADTLAAVARLTHHLHIYMSQLVLYTARLPPDDRARFIRNTGACQERLVVAVTTILTLLSRSLVSGDPLPALLPTPLLAVSALFDGHRHHHPDGAGQDARTLLAGERGRSFVCALHAFIPLLEAIDDLVVAVKRAVGEGARIDVAVLDDEDETSRLVG